MLIQNSWGSSYGNEGFVWVPYDIFNCETEYGKFVYELWTSIDYVNKKEEKKTEPEKPKYWRIQMGSFSIKENAYKLQQDIFNKTGRKAYVTNINNAWKLQFGAYINKQGAESVKNEMKKSGYNCFLTYY